MSLLAGSRAPRFVGSFALVSWLGSSCYRAEIDLRGLLDDGAPVAGAPSAGADSGPDCDPLADTPEQQACRSLRLPNRAECASVVPETAWAGCYDGGCTVCTDKNDQLPGYPYYFDWHPCCVPNHTCGVNTTLLCNARCPAPSEHDKVAPCSTVMP